MIETTVLDYLRDRLGVPVTMEVPEGASGTFVVLERTGAERHDHIRRMSLAVQSYAPTLLQAHNWTMPCRSHAGFAHA